LNISDPNPLPITSIILLSFTSDFANVNFGNIISHIFCSDLSRNIIVNMNLPTIWHPGHRPWPMPLWLRPWVLCYCATPLCLLSIKVHLPSSAPKQLPVGQQKSFIITFYIIRVLNTSWMRRQHNIINYYCSAHQNVRVRAIKCKTPLHRPSTMCIRKEAYYSLFNNTFYTAMHNARYSV